MSNLPNQRGQFFKSTNPVLENTIKEVVSGMNLGGGEGGGSIDTSNFATKTYVGQQITTEANARNSQITSAISTEAKARQDEIDLINIEIRKTNTSLETANEALWGTSAIIGILNGPDGAGKLSTIDNNLMQNSVEIGQIWAAIELITDKVNNGGGGIVDPGLPGTFTNSVEFYKGESNHQSLQTFTGSSIPVQGIQNFTFNANGDPQSHSTPNYSPNLFLAPVAAMSWGVQSNSPIPRLEIKLANTAYPSIKWNRSLRITAYIGFRDQQVLNNNMVTPESDIIRLVAYFEDGSIVTSSSIEMTKEEQMNIHYPVINVNSDNPFKLTGVGFYIDNIVAYQNWTNQYLDLKNLYIEYN